MIDRLIWMCLFGLIMVMGLDSGDYLQHILILLGSWAIYTIWN